MYVCVRVSVCKTPELIAVVALVPIGNVDESCFASLEPNSREMDMECAHRRCVVLLSSA